MERSAEGIHLFHPKRTERARIRAERREMYIRTDAEQLGEARREWDAEHQKAQAALRDAKMELNRMDLLITAYENKLAERLDPASEEWEETWKALRKLKLQREEFLQGVAALRFDRECRTRFKTTARYLWPLEEEKFFQEWLEKH